MTKILSKYIGPKSTVGALLLNMLTVYVAYTLTRLLFVGINWGMYHDHVDMPYLFSMLGAGLIFDTTAIMYTNVLFILLFLLPLHIKERPAFYKVVRWIYSIVNSVFLWGNLGDCVYFQFTSRRTTMSVLDEFSHEGIGNFVKIMATESLSYWYLFIIGIAMIWVFYKLFRTPDGRNTEPKVAYYVLQVVTLALASGLTIIGMRGGATMATRPITLSNANQYINQPIDAGIVLNTPFSLMRTIGKTAFVVPSYMSDDEVSALYSPLHVPNDSVAFRPMNVVVLIVESFGKQHFGSLNKEIENGKWEGFTPELDSIVSQSYTFRYSYANGRKSIDGMPSVLSSIPSFVEPFFLTPASLNDLSGIAGELSRNKGYHSAFFHGAMNGSMGFQAFAKSTGFQEYYGRTEYNEDSRYNGDDDFDGTWAIWDEEFLQFYADKMTEFPQPFVTGLFTATSHPPFALPERYKDIYPEESAKGIRADGSVVEAPLFRAVRYTDHAIGEFFRKAKKQPWYNNTIFVITADHVGGNVLPEYVTSLGLYSVPVILFAPGMPELRGYDEQRIVAQIDIMPTVLDLLHYDCPYVAFGQGAFSTPAEEKFTVNYVPASGVYQIISGDWMLQSDGKKMIGAYRFKTDTTLQDNLVNSPEFSAELDVLHRKLQAVVQDYMRRMTTNNLVARQ